jgi:hypothetical protein
LAKGLTPRDVVNAVNARRDTSLPRQLS